MFFSLSWRRLASTRAVDRKGGREYSSTLTPNAYCPEGDYIMKTAQVIVVGLALVAIAAQPQVDQAHQAKTAGGAAGKEKVPTPAELIARLKTQLADARKNWEQSPTRPEQYAKHLAEMQATLVQLCPDVAKLRACETLMAHAAVASAVAQAAVSSAIPTAAPAEAVLTGTYLKPNPAELKQRAEAEKWLTACAEANRLVAAIANTPPTGDKGKAMFDDLLKALNAVSNALPPEKKK